MARGFLAWTVLAGLTPCVLWAQERAREPGSIEYKRVTPRPSEVVARNAGRSAPLVLPVPGAFLLTILYDCLGHPLSRVPLHVMIEAPVRVDTTIVADSLGRLLIGPLPNGQVQGILRSIGHTPWSFSREVRTRVLDTLLVQMSASVGLISDCICAGGRSMGQQCCPPRTAYRCSVANGG